MQAIHTRYAGPTNTRGARVIAKCAARTIRVPWDHARNIDENHVAAACVIVQALGWGERTVMISGTLPDGSQCHTFAPADPVDNDLGWARVTRFDLDVRS